MMFSLVISGCGDNKKEKPEDHVTVHIEKGADGLAYEQGQKKPFTGIFEGYYRNGYKKAEIHFKNGKQNGLARMWYENGNQSYESNFYDGKLEGLSTEFRKDGTKYKERIFKDGKLMGTID